MCNAGTTIIFDRIFEPSIENIELVKILDHPFNEV